VPFLALLIGDWAISRIMGRPPVAAWRQAAYRVAMKSGSRLLPIALAVAILVGVGTLLVAAPPAGKVYSVAQINREIRLHPRAWVGRTVTVRAVGLTYFWGGGHGVAAGQQAFLVDPPFAGAFSSTAYGSRAVRLNGPGVAASLLVAGLRPGPSGVRRVLIALARVPVIGRFAGANPEIAPDIYRVRVVWAGPCPAPFAGFCPLVASAA